MNQWLEPAALLHSIVNMNAQKEAILGRRTIPHANHSSMSAGVSGIHWLVTMETLSASSLASEEGCCYVCEVRSITQQTNWHGVK